jgi:hypothetical protein
MFRCRREGAAGLIRTVRLPNFQAAPAFHVGEEMASTHRRIWPSPAN